MYDIEMQEMTPDFLKCWQAAGVHIDKQVQGGMQSWLQCHPYLCTAIDMGSQSISALINRGK